MQTFRRVVLGLVFLLGVGLIVFPLVDEMPKKTQGVDNVQDTFRDAMSKEGLKTSREDLVTMELMLKQLKEQTIPALAQRSNMTPQQFQQRMALFPNVAKGLAEVDTIMPRFEHTVGVMEAQGANFREADEIPTAHVPNTAVTYLFLVPGVILAVVGAGGLFFSFRNKRSVVPTIALGTSVVMGVLIVVGGLVTDQVGKTKAAEEMFDAFRPTFTQASYEEKRADMNTLTAFATDMQTKAIPALAALSGQPPQVYTAGIASEFQAVGKGLAETPRILARFDGLIEDIGHNIESFKNADSLPNEDTPVSQMPWYLTIPGIGLIVLGGAALLPLGRKDDGDAPATSSPNSTPVSP